MIPMKNSEQLTKDELHAFMNSYTLTEKSFAQILGVTWQAVRLWRSGDRPVPITTSKLVRLFIKHPKLLKEF